MIDIFPFSGFPVAVFGLGRTGLSAALALTKSGAEVWAWDDNFEVRELAEEQGISLVNLYKCDWKELTTLVLSPGIPHNLPKPHPIVALAKKANVEVINDIELLGRVQRMSSVIGITGTNGKSTTTALIGHILQVSGREAEVGGNLGPPVLELESLGEGGTYVIEMSSFQLELNLSITFDIAVLLNISAEHLERHGGLEGYIEAKKRIFHRQTKPRTAIIGVDDKFTQEIFSQLSNVDDQLVIPVSGYNEVENGICVVGGVLIDNTDSKSVPICDLREIPSLPGSHNWQNAAAAYAVCKTAGVEPHAIMACLQSYPGLVHRQEVFEIVDDVIFVNDSKATNSQAAARALACYKHIYWIVGGRPKDSSLSVCEPFFRHVEHAYLVGEASSIFEKELNGKINYTLAGNIETAIRRALVDIDRSRVKKPIILLSPACASFDQFNNFEERGDFFKKIVEMLPGHHMDPFEEPGLIPLALFERDLMV